MGEFTVGYKTYYGNISPGDNRIKYGSFSMPQLGIPLRGYIKTYLSNGAKFKVAIYNASNQFLAESDEGTVIGGGVVTSGPAYFTGQPAIDPGTIKLAHNQDLGRYGHGSGGSHQWYLRSYSSWPATLSTGATIGARLVVWVVFDEVFESSAELSCAFEIDISEDLPAKFEVGQNSSDLLARFEVGQGSKNLYAQFEVGQGSAELLGNAIIWNVGSAELLGNAIIRNIGSAELLGEAVIRNVGSAELLGEAVIRDIGSAELLGKFEAQATAELLAKAEIQQSGSVDLLGKVEVQQSGFAELLGKAEVQQSDSAELLGNAIIRHLGSAELLGKAEVQQSDSAELLGNAIIRHSDSKELLGKTIITQPDSEELLGRAVIRHVGTPVELLGKVVVRNVGSAELLGKGVVRGVGSAELLGKAEVQQSGSAELLGKAIIRHLGSAELLGKAEVQQSGSAELLGKAVVRNVGSVELLGKTVVKNVDVSDLLSNFRVKCQRLFGGNWQRKMWFKSNYYWRGRYCQTDDAFKFEYIAEVGLAGNVWTENAAARIDASGFAADAYGADFTVRGSEDGVPTTIHYSDGVDTWVAESDEASLTGWAWQNLTKVFDGTAPDSYRRVNLSANRADNQALWASAVFVDDDAGKQWVQTRKQTTSMDATAWDPAVAVSNVDNTDTIYGCSSRSMGIANAVADDVMWVYKEGDALRSRFFTGVWQDIQDIDTSTYSGKATFDFEHGMEPRMGHVVYVDADGTIKWRERDDGATDVWSAAETLDTGTTNHGGVGIVEHGSGWLWVFWKESNTIQYRLHLCTPETWYPVLAGEPLTFNVASDAVVNTSTVEQPQSPDCIPTGQAVPICWIGETAPTTPCAVGWGILVEFTIASLKGVFDVRQLTSTDLYARLEVGQDSAELLGRAVIRHVGTPVELLGNGIIKNEESVELLSKFDVGQDSAGLLSRFQVGQASVDFLAKFEVGQKAEELLGRAAIRHSASSDLKFSLYVSPWYLTAAEMLIGGRDRRMDMGGLDREMMIGGRKRRMKIK